MKGETQGEEEDLEMKLGTNWEWVESVVETSSKRSLTITS